MRNHTIIPAPTRTVTLDRTVNITPATKTVVTGMVVDMTHTIASAGAVLLFVFGFLPKILTNL